MKAPKSFLTLCLAAIAGIMTFSAKADEWKTVEKSEKNKPAWLAAGTPEGYLAVTTEAPTLQEARKMAEQEIQRCIIQAVATNVSYKTLQSASRDYVNGTSNESEYFSADFEMSTANLPFIQGVSLSQAKGTYWERRENKRSKQNLYVFTVLYPLPESELDNMRKEFRAYDDGMNSEYARVKDGFDTVASADEVEAAIASLLQLKEYFFDSVRHTEAETLLQRYRGVYRSVYLDTERVGDNHYRVYTKLNNRGFKSGRNLEATSDCAGNIKVTPTASGDAFDVTYSTDDCIPGEANAVKVSLRLGSARLSASFPV